VKRTKERGGTDQTTVEIREYYIVIKGYDIQFNFSGIWNSDIR